MFDPPRVGCRLVLAVSALAISLVALFAAAPQSAWAAADDIASGDCGTCVWSIDANGKLTIDPEDGKSGTLGDIYGTDSVPWYSYRADIKSAVIASGVKAGQYSDSLFQGCSKLVSADVSGLDTSKATSTSDMFYGCQRLKSIDLSMLDLSKVEHADGMFESCTLLSDIDFGDVDFSSLSRAYDMFNGCRSLKSFDLSLFSGSSLTQMFRMFQNCTALASVDMSGFTLPQATSMEDMFRGCSSVKSVSLSGAKFPKLTSMNSMFEDCSSLTSVDFSNLSIHCVDNLSDIFADCGELKNISLDGLDCDAASSVSCMFQNCSSLVEADFSSVKASSVQYSYRMFDGCSSLKMVDLSGIDSFLSSCSDMFDGCKSLTTIYDDGGFSILSDDDVFYNCISLRGGNGTIYNDNKRSSKYARIDKLGQSGYFTCTHSEVSKVDEVAPGTDKEGSVTHYECSVCEKSFEDAAAKKEMKAEDLVLHSWGDWSSNDDATCTKDGTKTRTCSVCGKSEKVTDGGSKVAHKPGEPKRENAKAATCTADGSHDEVTYCTACKAELSRKKVTDPKLGHKPGEVKVEQEKKPTCTEEGTYHEVRYCEICGEKVSDEAKTKPALGHDLVVKTSTKPAGLGSDGYVETSEVCKRCGEVLASSRLPISSAKSVSLVKSGLTYSGKTNRPTVKVVDAAGNTLRAGIDYSVSYADNGRDVGAHKVTVKGKGGYSFTKALSFVVNPKGTSLSKVAGAKKALTAKWGKRTSQTTGYQLRYSVKSNMAGAKSATVKSSKTTSKKVTKLKKKTKYYVQVRTYKVVKGKTYYSGWSKAKSVKTK